ncbi:SulP family inorganic anion transporter [Actinoalloteichus spitiensis]|uniref:SulP family inorganic anion transporter n=1 Tax=Actinoalloteichus spitiensis TaxID=252394 RepID=UPI0003802168|nr:bifunctional SulP family inorganic anion transporter/carbonic anhydrase [Actinoalloteichus spitiensis]
MQKRDESHPHGGEHTAVDPPETRPPGRLSSLARHDLPASLVVFLVALPLSLGIAVATGAPLMAGLVAAVVGGIVGGALSGAPLGVSGPAAGLVVIVAGFIEQFGWAATTGIVVAAGIVQVVLGLSRVAGVALALSPAVVHGMLAGIGITILIGQFQLVLGAEARTGALDNLRALASNLANAHLPTVVVGGLTIGLMLGWPRLRRVKAVPAALVAVVGATITAWGLNLDVDRVTLPEDPLGELALPEVPTGPVGAIVLAVLTLALVASVESLLAAVAVDRMHSGPRANLNKELVAQGTANVVSGSLGGLPVTQVIVRSTTNVAAGARTRASAVMHGVWIGALVLFLADTLELIPMAALAAVLVVVGAKLVNVAQIRMLWRHREFPVYATTMLGVVFIDLLYGVLLGIAVAVLVSLYRLAHQRVEVRERAPGEWLVRVQGSMVFLGAAGLTERLRSIPPGGSVMVELHIDFMDHAAFDALHEWRREYERQGGTVRVEETTGVWYQHVTDGARPRRRKSPVHVVPQWLASWRHWQHPARSAIPRQRERGEDPMILGMREFERRSAPLVRPYLAELAANGQRPSQLFLCCADSRVVPNVITTSGPGDLFTVRNVGNLVPPCGAPGDASVGAAVEYAVQALAVDSITVCGHSHCGAMTAVARGGTEGDSHLSTWLAHAEPLVVTPPSAPTNDPTEPEPACQRSLAVRNVVQQLANLMTYPCVREAVAGGRLRLVGLYFDISEAKVYLVDSETGELRVPDEGEAAVPLGDGAG